VTRVLALSVVRRIVKSPSCHRGSLPKPLAFLRHSQYFDFEDATFRPPLWPDMSVWLTTLMNDTRTFNGGQGYHGWHIDGPTQLGRHHKAWVLLSKNRSTARVNDANVARSNLEMVSAAARYAYNCDPNLGELEPDQEWQNTLGCRYAMQPGDMVFFREDVTHKSQGADVERLAAIVSTYRVPLRTAPMGEAFESEQAGFAEKKNERKF